MVPPISKRPRATATHLCLPFRGHPLLLHYRADVLAELGMDPPTNWQDVSAIGQAIADSGMDIAPIAMYYGLNVDQNLFNWLQPLVGRWHGHFR